jgi:hypothetical protein
MLRRYNFRFFSKQIFTNVLCPFTQYYYEPHSIVKSYEKNPENNDKYEKITYNPPINKKERTKQERRDQEKLKKKIKEQMEAERKGSKETNEKPKDSIFAADEVPPQRKYDKILAKELYFNPRQPDVYAQTTRKIAFLKEFQEPFTVTDQAVATLIDESDKALTKALGAHINTLVDPNFDIVAAQQNNETVVKNLQQLATLIPKLNYRLYPNIALNLAFKLKYKEDFAGIWRAIEKELLVILPNLTVSEIVKLKHAMAGFYPKAGSALLHKAFVDIVAHDVPGCDLSELLHAYHAFRLTHIDKLHYAAYNALITKDFKKDLEADPDNVANIVYTYANCRLDKYDRKRFRSTFEEKKEAQKLLEHFFDALENQIPKMTVEGLTRLALGVSLLRLENFNDIFLKIERALSKNVSKADAFQTATLIYAFSKGNDGQGAGKDKFYQDFEPLVTKHWESFNSHEKSRIYLAYAQRALVSKDLKDKVFGPWIKKSLPTLDYHDLANVAYGLMYEDVADKATWKAFARNVITQKLVCPMLYYRPLKLARYYMDALFPEWDYSQYEDTCFEVERYYNISRLYNNYERQEYYDFSRIIHIDLNFDVKIWLEWENLYNIDYAFMPQKAAILLQKDRDTLPGTILPTPAYKLREKILKANKWTLLNVNWKEFQDMGPGRAEWIKGKAEELLKKTEVNIKKDEEERRASVLAHLDEVYSRIDDAARRKTLDRYSMFKELN